MACSSLHEHTRQISDSDDEYDENDINYADYADETHGQPPSFPIHPTPELNKARNIAIHQIFKKGEHSRPTTRLKSKGGAAEYTRADLEHVPHCQQAEFSHSSCLGSNTTHQKEKTNKPDDQFKSRLLARLTSITWRERYLSPDLQKKIFQERKAIFDREKAAREKVERFHLAKEAAAEGLTHQMRRQKAERDEARKRYEKGRFGEEFGKGAKKRKDRRKAAAHDMIYEQWLHKQAAGEDSRRADPPG